MAGSDALTTIEVRKKTGASTNSTATLTISRNADGSYRFTSSTGVVKKGHSNEFMRQLFNHINALT